MPRRLPKHVERWRDRHGKIRLYFRIGKGPRTPLPSDVRSKDFEERYEACLCGKRSVARTKGRAATNGQASRGTLAALIESYKKSQDYIGTRASTKKGYQSRLEWLRTTNGHRIVEQMSRAGIQNHVMQPFAGKPGAAHALLKMLRILIRHANNTGVLDHDPSVGIKRPKLSEVRAWSDDEISQFRRFWRLETTQRLAFELQLRTGQRVSDVCRMTWADIRDDRSIRLTQLKTGERLVIPLHSDLELALSATKREHVVIVSTAYGRAFTSKGYGQFLRKAIEAAGLPLACRPHGLRKAAGRLLAEAGCTAKEIMAVLGHRDIAQASLYTRDADQAHLAKSAIARLSDINRTDLPKPNILGLGSFRKKSEAKKS